MRTPPASATRHVTPTSPPRQASPSRGCARQAVSIGTTSSGLGGEHKTRPRLGAAAVGKTPGPAGARSNTHMFMLDKSNLQIADLLLDWIDTHVEHAVK